jgi:hypothetical protein
LFIKIKETKIIKLILLVTAVWQDWGFSGITVFNSYFRLAENTRFQNPQTLPSAGTLADIL